MDRPDWVTRAMQRRAANVADADIAEELGIHKKALWTRVAAWNSKNPHDPIPRPETRPETPWYVQAAEMQRDRGLTAEDIARVTGRDVASVRRWLSTARMSGLLPPHETLRKAGGLTTLEHFRNKGAAPRRGALGTVIDALSHRQVERLLNMLRSDDETVADALARVVRDAIPDE